jgi:transcriptional regulator with XRE-family HTH domain
VEPVTQYDRERRELGGRLRELRVAAELTGTELARLMGISQSKLSKIETGRVSASVEDIERFADALKLPEDVRESLLDHATTILTEFNTWRVLTRRGLQRKQREVYEIEMSSTVMKTFHAILIPGLLQTAEYTRQLLLKAGFRDSDRLAEAVTTRLERQTLLYDQGRHFEFLIAESAFRFRYGSVPTMLAQLDRISSLATLPNVKIGIIPWSAEVPTVPLSGFDIYDDKLVTVETITAEITVHDANDIQLYLNTFESLTTAAVYDEPAGNALMRIAEEYKSLL